MHRLFLEQPIPDPQQRLAIGGDEAAHALRVKRLQVGNLLRLLDGAGVVAEARVETIRPGSRKDGPTLEVLVTDRREIPPERPILEVYTATPKAARVDDMIDQLSQLGAAAWGPLSTARGVVDPRETKLARLEKIACEAAKQCERAWLLRIGRPRTLQEVLSERAAAIILADSGGEPFRSATEPLRLLIGPEGGWTPDEIAAARAAGAFITRFGPHTMRIETAAAAAAAVIMASAASMP